LESPEVATIVVDPDNVQWGWSEPVAGFRPKPVREWLSEPLEPEAKCYVFDGKPYLLYPDWDYAEDWSGDYLREVHPFSVAIGGQPIAGLEWRALVARGSVNRGKE
jgi:hypothetical protein